MGRHDDQKIYQTFEEFEREELRRDGFYASVDEVLDEMFAGELDFESDPRRRGSQKGDDDDEE